LQARALFDANVAVIGPQIMFGQDLGSPLA
jgi:hypothetical protein